MSIAISRIADLRNNNDPSVGGGRGVGSGAMTGRERRDEARRGSRAPGATRREAPWGPRVQERLLPTLNAVLMPGTTGLPPQLQRRTCSRNHFSSFPSSLSLEFAVVVVVVVLVSRSPNGAPFGVPRGRLAILSSLSPRFSSLLLLHLRALFSAPFVSFRAPRRPRRARSRRHPSAFPRYFYRRLTFCLLLQSLVLFFLFIFQMLHTLVPADRYIFSLLSLSRSMRPLFLSGTIYLSIEEIALGKGGVPASKEGKPRSSLPRRNFARFRFENRR